MSRPKRPPAAPRPTSPTPAVAASRIGSGRLLRWLAGIAIIVSAVVGVWAWQREPTPGPPPELTPGQAEPVVARAIDDARAVVLNDRRRADAWGELGMLFAAHDFVTEAAECYATAHRLDRSDSRWPYLLGVQQSKIDIGPAVPLLEAAAACRGPTAEHEAIAQSRLGEIYLVAGRLPDAEQVFSRQFARAPTDARAALGLGQALLAAGKTAESIAPLSTASRSPHARKRATSLLALASRALRDEAAAAEHERLATGMPDDPEWPDPFLSPVATKRVSSRAALDELDALAREGRVLETVPLLERIAREQPESLCQVLVTLGNTYVQTNQPAAAEKHLREAIRLDPASVEAHVLLGISLFGQAKAAGTPAPRRDPLYRDAAEAFRRATELKPDHAVAHTYRGECFKAIGDRARAVEEFRAAAKYRPEVPAIQLSLIEALLDDGQMAEATAQLREAERVVPAGNPRLVKVRERLGSKP